MVEVQPSDTDVSGLGMDAGSYAALIAG
jgi:hypothetical protein